MRPGIGVDPNPPRDAKGTVPCASLPQDLRLLLGELLVREDPLLVQGPELLELLDRVRRGGRRRLLVGRLLVGGLLGGVLLRPAVGLAARDAVADAGGRSGDHRCAGDAAKQSGHGVPSSTWWSLRSPQAMRGWPGRG